MTVDPRLAVSSFSLREQLGPIRFVFRDASGADQVMHADIPRLLPISDFPRRALEELGVDKVETVGFHFTGLDDPEIGLFEKALADTGVGLVNTCLDMGDLLDPDDGRRAGDLIVLKQWVARFAGMGSQFVRVNPGSPATPWGQATPAARLVDALGELGEFAQSQGARLLVENHNGLGSDPVWMKALLDQVEAHCGLLLDLGNLEPLLSGLRAATHGVEDILAVDLSTALAGLDLAPLYAAVEALAPRAELVSVKTNWVDEGGGVGAVDLGRAMGVLVGAGYDGLLSVEYEGFGGDPWAKTRRVVEASSAAFAGAQAR